MAITKIKRDCHGLYVRTEGQVYRPEEAELVPFGQYHLKNGYTTQFTEGMEVKVRSINQTPLCRVRSAERTEEWCSHGVYMGKQAKPSEQCWTLAKG